MLVSDLMTALLSAAEKGSTIAQIVRAENTLLELLIEEKEGKEKNDRFVQDFKTLADVLIQEMVRHDLSVKFPGIGESVYGEESNCFTNTAGKSVTVQLCSTPQLTADLLREVLGGNEKAASILAGALHEDFITTVSIPQTQQEIPLENVGVWIDPIDSTAQFIRGHTGREDSHGIVEEGLQCVTVLVGAFDKSTGLPVAGVCVQPFATHDEDTEKWLSSTTWGISYKDVKMSSITSQLTTPRKHSLIISSSENEQVRKQLGKKFTLHSAAGAGYKILCTLLGNVDAYVLSKPTIYKWDCCAPHAVLKSIGGGIELFLKEKEIQGGCHSELQYQFSTQDGSNCFHGIIAYRTDDVLKDVIECLKT